MIIKNMDKAKKVGVEGLQISVNPTQTGWTRKVTFSLWEKGGNIRLYASYVDYDRQGRRRNHSNLDGYVDLATGEVVGKNHKLYEALEKAEIN
jgi:hypothetical protein